MAYFRQSVPSAYYIIILLLVSHSKFCVAVPVRSRHVPLWITREDTNFHGRGLVLCAGGDDLLMRALALVSTIRFHLQSNVPIQLFHAGAEIAPEILQHLRTTLQVNTVFGACVGVGGE